MESWLFKEANELKCPCCGSMGIFEEMEIPTGSCQNCGEEYVYYLADSYMMLKDIRGTKIC